MAKQGQGVALDPPGAKPLDLKYMKINGFPKADSFWKPIYYHSIKVQGLGPWWVQGKALVLLGYGSLQTVAGISIITACREGRYSSVSTKRRVLAAVPPTEPAYGSGFALIGHCEGQSGASAGSKLADPLSMGVPTGPECHVRCHALNDHRIPLRVPWRPLQSTGSRDATGFSSPTAAGRASAATRAARSRIE